MRWRILILLGLFFLLTLKSAGAHAILAQSNPPANAMLSEAPAEIRLWFTEPLEARFSHIQLGDSQGAMIPDITSQVDAADPEQMFIQPGALPPGVYTVVWSVASAADGHHTEGSFPLTIGAPAAGEASVEPAATSIPGVATVVRWLNLLGLALAVGSIGFVCFVWQPAVKKQWAEAEQRLRRVIWAGWWLLGLGSVLLLLLQTAIMANISLTQALGHPALGEVIQHSRFGQIWSARMTLWGLLGAVLLWMRLHSGWRWVALSIGGVILALTSLYSHAAASPEALTAVVSDWLHLTMTALWVGGLWQFCSIIYPVRRHASSAALVLGRLTGYFSNYARIATAGLAVTGIYAAWLQVGSLDGLLTTLYGRLLLVKFALILPLLGIAGVNLFITQRRLQAGQEVWGGRLRLLVGVEIVLAVGILAAVGAMTSINPARNELQQRALAAAQVAAETAALAAAPTPQPLSNMAMIDGLHIHLTIEPGYVGENQFTVALSRMDNGLPIGDASLIRLRFEHQSENLGRSELRITEGKNGLYQVTGSNLSTVGDWQIRITIQRPEQFDTVVDFTPQVELSPPLPAPPPLPAFEPMPLPYRLPILVGLGGLALALGGYFIRQSHLPYQPGARLLALLLIVLGALFLFSTILRSV